MSSMTGSTTVDLTSIESIIRAVYFSISGAAGAPRDWAMDKLLFHPAARLMPTRPLPDGGSAVEVLDVDGYAASRSPIFEVNDFYEVEIARRELRFGNVATVLSAYESRRTPDGRPFLRGLNSFQFWWDGTRWWIMSVLWDNEREGVVLPADLAGSGEAR